MAVAAPALAIASVVASVGSTAYSFYAQRQQAKAEADSQKQYNEQLNLQAAESYGDLSPAEIDAHRQAQEEAMNQQAEAFRAKGRVNVFAAASGTLGGSVDSLLFGVDQQRDKNINSILTQRESGLYSIKQQAESIRQNAISGQNRQIINTPSWLEGGLKVGGSLIQGLDSYGRMNDTFKLQGKASQGSSGSGATGSV